MHPDGEGASATSAVTKYPAPVQRLDQWLKASRAFVSCPHQLRAPITSNNLDSPAIIWVVFIRRQEPGIRTSFGGVCGEIDSNRVFSNKPVTFWRSRHCAQEVTRCSVANMNSDKKPRSTFPLRLAASSRQWAELLADRDGISLNHFIDLAVAEKVHKLLAENPSLATITSSQNPADPKKTS
jgi:hypothetical protein